MKQLEFNNFHNVFKCFAKHGWNYGEVSNFEVENELSTFKIECQYLAKEINQYYDRFFIECKGLLCYDANNNKINFDDYIKQYSVIASVSGEQEVLKLVMQNKQEEEEQFVCSISCNFFKIYDQHENEITPETLIKIYDKVSWDWIDRNIINR